MRVVLVSLSMIAPFALAGAAPPQDPAIDPACANVRVAIPPELAGWSNQTAVSAGVKPGDGATVTVGQGARVALHPAKHLALLPAPAKGGGEGSGGTLSFAITTAGTYRVALGGGAWIDVVQGGKALTSIAHGHGPKCTGVRKMVDFKLEPGNYTLQLAGSDSETLSLLVARLA